MILRVLWSVSIVDVLHSCVRHRLKCLVLVIAAALCISPALATEPPTVVADAVEQISAADRQLQIDGLRTSEDTSAAVKQLIAIDVELLADDSSTLDAVKTGILIALAEHANPPALEHLRSVFETQTPRRHDAAYAISLAALNRPTSDQDWRYLVRSLTIVEDEQAVSVLKSLRKYRRRATKATWIREVILAGLRLTHEQLPAAIDLLSYWTGHSADSSESAEQQLQGFQAWFREHYPNEPPPELPVDPPNAKWTAAKLATLMAERPSDAVAFTAGAAAYSKVFSKANCNKCHRRDGGSDLPAGDQLGPNLTSLGWRRQPQEILSAILYPSHRLNDEYPVTTVLLTSGKSVSGLMMPDTEDRMKIVTADSKEVVFAKSEIEDVAPSKISNMPSGLLEVLSAEEIKNLFAFLTQRSGDYDPHRE